MPFIGNQPALSYTSFAKQDFTTSATTSYTLNNPVANANELALFINFVRQEPTTAYTASGTILTLTSATSASDDMYCVFLGKAVQTVNPPAGSVDSSKINYPLTTFSSTGIDDNATANALTIDSSSNLQFNSGYGSVATAYGCRAWINFNGTGTVAINGNGNISSVVDNGIGDYLINLSTAMTDTNYTAVTGGLRTGLHGSICVISIINSTSQINIGITTGAGTASDADKVHVSVFR